MRTDLNDILAAQPTQHSLDWYRARLGKFTGSQVSRLMKSGRGAVSYITEVVAERMLNPSVVMMDELFEEYLMQTTASSKTLAWGNDQEMNAKDLYAKLRKVKITSCGAVELSPWFASSPDGLVLDADGCVEVKCPTPKVHVEYMVNVHNADDLKKVCPEYYWQCVAHMAVTGADWCDWMSYCPFNKRPLHIVRIVRDLDAESQLHERVDAAEMMAKEMIEKADKS